MTGEKGLHRVKVGCCGFPVGRQDYFSQFRVVEVQQTFYIDWERDWLPRKHSRNCS